QPEQGSWDHSKRQSAHPNLPDSLAGANLRTIGAPQRPSVPLMTMTTTVTSTIDPTTTAKDKLVESSIFGDGSSSRADHTVGGFSGLTGSDFIVGGIRNVVNPDTNIQKVAEVRMRAEFNIKEKRRLCVVVEEKNLLLKTRDEEVTNLKAQLLVKEAEATEVIRLRVEVQTLVNRNIVLERFRH
ncbi:hypothetical protein Tco_0300614, partial [Tanacetum coccineum]